MTTGTIKKVIADRGFGFITAADAKEYFFHRAGLDGSLDFDRLNGGEKVEFEIEEGPKGPRASKVRAAAWGQYHAGSSTLGRAAFPSDRSCTVRTAFVSTYTPRICGLASYTAELSRVTPNREIVALYSDEPADKHAFEVHHRIRLDERPDYAGRPPRSRAAPTWCRSSSMPRRGAGSMASPCSISSMG